MRQADTKTKDSRAVTIAMSKRRAVERQLDEHVTDLRHHVNAMPPCALTSLDIFGHGGELRWRKLPPAAGSIRIDFTLGVLPVTPANLAAAIGQRQVRHAIASLIHRAAGGSATDVRLACATVSHVVFNQAERYPLDRPDLRRPDEGGPS